LLQSIGLAISIYFLSLWLLGIRKQHFFPAK